MKRVYKSWLCSSPMSGKLIQKANECGADIIHFDLEDSVPQQLKAAARQDVQQCLANRLPGVVAIRLNAISSMNGIRDLLWLDAIKHNVDILILPKIETAGEIHLVQQLLKEIGAEIQLFAIIETLNGLSGLHEIAAAGGMLKGLILGVADLSSQMGIPINGRGLAMNSIKYQLGLAAATNGLLAIDSPCFSINDPAVLQEEIAIAKEMGFSGKIAIHPSQVPLINAGFLPTGAELAHANAVINTLNNPGQGVNKLDGCMIGPPFVRQSLNVLSRMGADQPI